MADSSKIEWTEATWNPTTGCSKVSQGCKNCYALRDWPRLSANPKSVYFGRDFTDVQMHPDRLWQPLKWRKPRRVFVNSMSDLFHEEVPFDFVAAIFGIMAATPQHAYQILTKRPERMTEFFRWCEQQDAGTEGTLGLLHCVWEALKHEHHHHPLSSDGPLHATYCADPGGAWPLPNAWLGVSVEDQETADERIPMLLETPAAVRFVSYEPALGPVDFRSLGGVDVVGGRLGWNVLHQESSSIDWVIVGGESGPRARHFDVDWARAIITQCSVEGVPCFVKQLGARPTGLRWLLKDRKGGDPGEWPEDLRVRQFPTGGDHNGQGVHRG